MNDEIAERLQGLPPNLPDQHDRFELVRGRVVRRRRNRTIISSVLAAAVIVAGVSVATVGSSPSQNNSIDAADQSDASGTQPFSDPPAGSKWVGMNNLVLAVPADWPVLSSPCGDGSPAVVLDGTLSAVTKCVTRDEDVRVSLIPLNGAQPAESGEVVCSRGGTAPSCWVNRAFVDEGVLVRIESRQTDAAKEVERILGTAMVLPDGWTTVPFGGEHSISKRVLVLKEAGFLVDDPGYSGFDPPAQSEPESGSPVRKGATITLSPVGYPKPRQDPEAQELTVKVELLSPYGGGVSEPGSAYWNASQRTLTYQPDSASVCLPEGSAGRSGGSISLTLMSVNDPGCTLTDKQPIVTISGVTEAPTELTVTEDGEARTVPVVNDARRGGVDGLVPAAASLCPNGTVSGKFIRGGAPQGRSLEDALNPYPGAVVGPRDSRSALATVRVSGKPLQVIGVSRGDNSGWFVNEEVTCGE